eukprot:GHVL01037809.1.p1 GENE.GHVL01037809.1~~GHVL01037809.1.p1  ORF type:complete len:218 (-),score=23.64 GHVL01037809.1:131-784(-)
MKKSGGFLVLVESECKNNSSRKRDDSSDSYSHTSNETTPKLPLTTLVNRGQLNNDDSYDEMRDSDSSTSSNLDSAPRASSSRPVTQLSFADAFANTDIISKPEDDDEDDAPPRPSADPSRIGGIDVPSIDLSQSQSLRLPIPNRHNAEVDEGTWIHRLNSHWFDQMDSKRLSSSPKVRFTTPTPRVNRKSQPHIRGGSRRSESPRASGACSNRHRGS